MTELDGGHKVEGLVWPQVVVVVLPQLAVFAHLAQGGEEVVIEQFAAKRAIKPLDVSVLGRAGGLYPV